MRIKNNTTKYLWIGIALILSLQVFSFSYNNWITKSDIVYIDNGKLLNGYQGMLDARKEFEQKSLAWKSNIDTLAMEVTKAIQGYEKESQDMTQKERELSQQLIKTKQKQLQNYQQAIQQQSAQADSEMTEQVLTKVNAFLENYGKDNNYQIIMGANSSGNIIYAKEGLDITEEVLDALNKQYIGG